MVPPGHPSIDDACSTSLPSTQVLVISQTGVTATKTLITLAALATVIATPALAAYKTTERASSSYYVSSPVEFDGKQVGQDPDANVRLMLLRDAQSGLE